MRRPGRSRALRLLALAVLALLTAGCVRGCTSRRPPIHINPNMDHQPKYTAQSPSGFFYDGKTMRDPVPGTVARGELRDDSPYWTGRDAAGELVAAMPVEVTAELLERGRERYEIYCQPCHDARGDGKGILFQKGNVPMPGFKDERLLGEPDGHFFDVITNGKGLMTSYRWPVTVADRWAIIAHVRRLQGRLDAPGEMLAEAR